MQEMSDTISAWGDRRVHQVEPPYYRETSVSAYKVDNTRLGPPDRRVSADKRGKSIPAGGVPLMKGPDTEAEYVEACIAYAEHADTTDDSCEVCQRFLAARAARGAR